MDGDGSTVNVNIVPISRRCFIAIEACSKNIYTIATRGINVYSTASLLKIIMIGEQ